MMKSEPGTYILLLRCLSKASVQVGRWQQIGLETGYYLYVGSAFGPGGVQARVLRHCREEKPNHWHIDYLREFVHPLGAWYSHATKPLEHQWARILHNMSGMMPIQGFGCSDCNCYSHLFYTTTAPDQALFCKLAGGNVGTWLYRN